MSVMPVLVQVLLPPSIRGNFSHSGNLHVYDDDDDDDDRILQNDDTQKICMYNGDVEEEVYDTENDDGGVVIVMSMMVVLIVVMVMLGMMIRMPIIQKLSNQPNWPDFSLLQKRTAAVVE